MDIELEKKLINKYPDLFRNKDKPVTQSLMAFAFECDNGWFKLIDELCENIMKECAGTEGIPSVIQVKEKYAELRFYLDWYTPKITKLIEEAECKSQAVCEICGGEGKLHCRREWLKTLCTKHAKAMNYEKNK